MNTWAPLFSKIVDSSLWDEDDFTVKIFITMLAKKDADHVVRGSAYNIAQWAKKPKEEARVIQALKRLQEPDRRRLEPQPFDGRRIEKVEDGFLILNGQHYEDLMRKANRREYKTAKQREYRAKANSPTMAERAVESAKTDRDKLRALELLDQVPRGSYGSGAQAQSPDGSIEPSSALTSSGESGGLKGDENGSAEAPADDTPDPDAMP